MKTSNQSININTSTITQHYKYMKKLLIIAATTFVATALHAQVYVNIVGSTAGRSAVDAQIRAIFGSSVQYASADAASGSATRAIYKGTFNGKQYIVRTAYGGSADGVNMVRNATPQQLLNENVAVAAGGNTLTGAAIVLDPVGGANTFAHIGFSDIFASTLGLVPTDVDEKVGVITFYWLASKGATGIDNLTSAAVRQLYSNEFLPLSIATGNASDTGKNLLGLGRNSSSGTRATAMAECGYGNFKTVTQYSVNIVDGTITGNPTLLESNGGLSGGGDIANALKATSNSSNMLYIGYLGASDAVNNAIPGGAIPLKWNGVAFSEEAIYQGQYTFWGYLHQNRMNSLNADQELFFNELATRLKENGGSGLLKISDMKVQRDADGAPCYSIN